MKFDGINLYPNGEELKKQTAWDKVKYFFLFWKRKNLHPFLDKSIFL